MQQTYMITTSTWERRDLFRNERWANLLMDTIYHYRGSAYWLHEFVIMPDHLHALITPLTSLEKAVQFIKGGFSYRAKKELTSNLEIWQKGFSDHRIRDASDYRIHAIYVRQNPVRKHLCEKAEQYLYSSASGRFELDGAPQGLKPTSSKELDGAAEAAPFQSNTGRGLATASPFSKTSTTDSATEPLHPALKDFK
jgi:putative transposase